MGKQTPTPPPPCARPAHRRPKEHRPLCSRTGEKAARSVEERTVVHVEGPGLRSAPGASTFFLPLRIIWKWNRSAAAGFKGGVSLLRYGDLGRRPDLKEGLYSKVPTRNGGVPDWSTGLCVRPCDAARLTFRFSASGTFRAVGYVSVDKCRHLVDRAGILW
eukprot:gene10617-biopygen4793